jgi:hypothetical protein
MFFPFHSFDAQIRDYESLVTMSASSSSCDLHVLIVGSGITGLLLAQGLKRVSQFFSFCRLSDLTRSRPVSAPASMRKKVKDTSPTESGPAQSTGASHISRLSYRLLCMNAFMRPIAIPSQALLRRPLSTTALQEKCSKNFSCRG